MSNNSKEKKSLLAPEKVLDRFAWSREYRSGADESIDEPPMFSTDDWSWELEDSMSSDFQWPSVSVVSEGNETLPEQASSQAKPTENQTESSSSTEIRLCDADIPRLLLERRELVWRRLSTQEAFILELVDSRTSVGDIADVVGGSRQLVYHSLNRLVEIGVIELTLE